MAPSGFSTASVITRWQRLNKGQRLVTGIIGALFALWAVDLMAFRPLRRRLREMGREVQGTKAKLLEATIADQNAANVTKAFKAYAPYAAASGSPETELAGLLSDVETTIRKSGVVLLNLKPSARSASSETISVAVDGESSPEQLMRLLDQLQRSQRALKVTELSIRVSESKTLRVAMVVSKLLLR